MNIRLQECCERLVSNRDAIHSAFRWESGTMALAGSSFYVGLDQDVDIEKMKRCEQLLKENTGMFSNCRGNVKMPLICKMASSEEPEAYFECVNTIRHKMVKPKWANGEYKVLAAMTIADHLGEQNPEEMIEKTVELYMKMKEEHPWLTSDEDLPFASMLAVSGLDTDALVCEMEKCYALLGEKFHDKNAIQSVSHVLSIYPETAEKKVEKLFQLFDELKTNDHKYGKGYELALLGTLASLDLPMDQVAKEIGEADDFLKQQKGFGNLAMGSSTRRMYAALMVMDAHQPPADPSHQTMVNTTLAIVIMMEIMMIMIMTSTMAATSSS